MLHAVIYRESNLYLMIIYFDGIWKKLAMFFTFFFNQWASVSGTMLWKAPCLLLYIMNSSHHDPEPNQLGKK
jgi:DNA gyrase inhibitor GyrI